MNGGIGKLAATVTCVIIAAIISVRIIPGDLTGADPQHKLRMLLGREDALSRPDAVIAEMRPVMQDLLSGEPLASEPLYTYAILAGREGDRALNEALRRNPRILPARLLRAQRSLEEGRYDETARELGTLISVDRRRLDEYLAALTEVSSFPEGQNAVLELLENNPWWEGRLMERLNSQSPDFQFLLEASRLVEEARPAFMERLVKEGRLDMALEAWFEFTGIDRASVNWPYNPAFEDTGVLPPFNWQIMDGVSEILSRGGLYVVHTARNDVVFARQFTVLQPGEYDLSAAATGQMVTGAGDVLIRISCAASGDILVGLSLGRSTEGDIEAADRFTVPEEDCPFQRIDIAGTTGQFPRVSRLEIDRLNITPVSAGQGEG